MSVSSLNTSSLHEVFKQIQQREPFTPSHPILSLTLVRQKISTYTMNISPELIQVYAIYELLQEVLVVPLGKERMTSTSALGYLQSDYQSSHKKRQSYSLLYYLYLRSDCDLPPNDRLCAILGITERTLQRRIQRGLQHVIFDLMAAEVKARANRPAIILAPREKTG